jgi:hypothetical protein
MYIQTNPRVDYRSIAKKRWPKIVWIEGTGKYALVVYCKNMSVSLYRTESEAIRAKRRINDIGCGEMCNNNHSIINLPDKGV